MKKEEALILNKWIDFSIAIKKMYDKLIVLEQNDQQESEEYQNLVYLLPTAIKIENDIISSLKLTKENYTEIREIIDANIEQIHEEVINDQNNQFDAIRRSNRLDILLLEYNNFFEKKSTPNLFETILMINYQEELTSLKYANEYLNKLTTNHIAMIERALKKVNDTEIKNYLISLKYRIICITPNYENDFVFFHCRVLPTININQGIDPIDDYTIEDIIEYNKISLHDGFMEDLIELLCLDNFIIDNPNNKKILSRLLTLNEARLISLEDSTFIEYMQNETIAKYPDNPNCSRIISLIEETFKDAYDYLQKKKKR